MPTQSAALSEVLKGLVVAFGGATPTSDGLGELYTDLIAAVEASGGGTQGPQGNQGTQGGTGPQGPQGGVQGAQGFQGAQGSQGAQGAAGSNGAQGPQGTQGHQGFTGTTGNQGSQGVQGAQGNQGFQGTQGVQGAQGNQGSQGSQGNQGNQGFQGNAGGPQGPQGFQGAQGATGSQGTQGTQGLQGSQGNQGTQGNQGAQGSQGAGGGAWTLITSSVLGAPAASFDFTSIAGSYHHLVVIVSAQSSASAESDNFHVQLNADTAADYRSVGTTNDGSTLAAHAATVAAMASDVADLPAGNAFNHLTGGLELWIQNYTDTSNYKNALWRSGFTDSVHSAHCLAEYFFTLEVLQAITEVKVFPATGPNFTAGSAAYLYGVT